VHRNREIRPRAVVWGLAVAACLSVALPGAGIAADKPNPNPLWNAYPLDEDQASSSGGASQNAATTTTSPQPAAPAAATTQPVTVTDTAGDGPPWVLMIVAAAGGALLVVVLLTLQGRRSRRREEALGGVDDDWPWLGPSHSNGTGEVRGARLRVVTNGAAADVESEQNRGAERAVEPAANGTASEWVADRDRGVEAEREMGVAPAQGAAAERVAEPQPEPEREPVASGAGPASESVESEAADEWAADRGQETRADAAAEREPSAEESAAEREPEPVEEPEAEPQPVAEAPMNGAAAEHEPEPAVEAYVNGAAAKPERASNGIAPESEREPEFDVVEAAAVPRQRFDRAPANGKQPSAPRRGPVCQVRWSAAAKCLFAVAADANGVEHRIAWSPPIAWGQAGPPDEDSREARAALRVLAKDLRDKGWRPMRAKGDDFDETRWYARRFRFPIVEGDDDPAPWQHGPPVAALSPPNQ
jgi:hypothetical protein